MPDVSVVTPLWICGALKRVIRILSGIEIDAADSGRACTRVRRMSVGKCWGHSGCLAVVLVAGGKWPVCPSKWAVQLWPSCIRAVLAHERHCGTVDCKGSVACPSAVAWCINSGEDCVSRCSELTSWRPGVDQWLHCGQSEPGSAGSVCPVRGCAPMRIAVDVYSLMTSD